uniref:LIM zinc-binding domain-containing protein n=1 Tax=Mesocestoides corti TaxID=53468 RepID=A0A5K3FW59_MESCO
TRRTTNNTFHAFAHTHTPTHICHCRPSNGTRVCGVKIIPSASCDWRVQAGSLISSVLNRSTEAQANYLASNWAPESAPANQQRDLVITLCNCIIHFFAVKMSNKCGSCEKPVYAAEERRFGDVAYHKQCFKCSMCNKPVDSTTGAQHERTLYCKTC